MKLIITEYKEHVEVFVQNEVGVRHYVFTFDNIKEANAFVKGFGCCRNIANSEIQSIPATAERRHG